MDNTEYTIKKDEIRSLIDQREYARAAEIADTIDWRRVRSVMMLCTVSDLYKINRRYEDAKNMLLLAYEFRPGGRSICYSLCELCIKMQEFVEAIGYYKEFVQAAPKDPDRYVLQYKLYEAQDVSLEERIDVLKELKQKEYKEKWLYELAYLYHRIGQATLCVEECDDLILWFGDGKYVYKAMELKMLHQPLTLSQQEKYDHRFDNIQVRENAAKTAQTVVYPKIEEKPVNRGGFPGIGQPRTERQQSYERQDYGNEREMERILKSPTMDLGGRTPVVREPSRVFREAESIERNVAAQDIHVPIMDMGRYNTMNLQAELAAGLEEVLGREERASDRITQSIFAPMMENDDEADMAQLDLPDREEPEELLENVGETTETEVFFGETGEVGGFNMAGRRDIVPDLGYGVGEETKVFEFAHARSWSEPYDVRNVRPGASGGWASPEELVRETDAEETVGSSPSSEILVEEIPNEVSETEQEVFVREEPSSRESFAWEERPSSRESFAREELSPSRESFAREESSPSRESFAREEPSPSRESFAWEESLPSRENPVREEISSERENRDTVERAAASPERKPAEDETARQAMDQIRIENRAKEQILSAQPPRELAKVLAQESDGQISFVMPETEVVEKQITGQMSIQDILAEWERRKRESAEKRKEELQRQIQQQTGEMFTEFEAAVRDGLLEKLEKESVETDDFAPGEPVTFEESGEEPAGLEQEEFFGEEEAAPAPETVEESGEEAPAPVSEASGWFVPGSWQIAEEAESAVEPVSAPEEEPAEESAPEPVSEASGWFTPGSWQPAEEAESAVEPASAPEEEPVAEIEEEPTLEGEPVAEPATEPAPAAEPELAPEEEPAPEPVAAPEPVPEEEPVEEPAPAPAPETSISEEENGEPDDFAQEEEPEKFEEYGEDEETAAPEEPPEKKVKTVEEDDDWNRVVEETRQSAADPEEQEEQEDQGTVRKLTSEEKELYAPYIQTRSAREQLVRAIDSISMAAYTGNIVITGEEGVNTVGLAKNMIRQVQSSDRNFAGKVAKISGQGLNQRDVKETLVQLKSGALIIQKASGMTIGTAAEVYRTLQQDNLGLIIAMEDTKKGIAKLFAEYPPLKECFTARMDVEALSNDTLAAFGRRYAREMEYSIDELGMLALHRRIEEMQTVDHVVTVVEVKDIVDKAIRHAKKKNLGHFMDVLLAKRYDEEDMVILTEKDFV